MTRRSRKHAAPRVLLAVLGAFGLAGCSGAPPEVAPSADAAPDAPTSTEAGAATVDGSVATDGGTGEADRDAAAQPTDAAFDADVSVPELDAGAPADANADADANANADASADADAGPPDSDGDGTPDPQDCAPNDPTRWQLLAYSYRDADGDTYTVSQSGQVCSGATLPAGYTSTANGDDCDDTNPSVYVLASVYADVDGDGVGAGAAQTMCIGASPPPGDSLAGTDCAPTDPTAWQLLPFSYRDGDGDTYTVGMSGEACSGASLPAGYATIAKGDDCDDTNPLIYDWVTAYADVDGDGVGAGTGVLVCTNGSEPASDSATDTDCAPTDPTRWQMLPYAFVDMDGDGATVPQAGTVCSGATLLPPYYATAHGNDCDDTNPAVTQWMIVYPDADGDGAGRLPLQILCEGSAVPAGYSRYGDDEDDTNASIGPLPPEEILPLFY